MNRLDWRVLKINLETLNQKIVYQSFDMQDSLDYCKKMNDKNKQQNDMESHNTIFKVVRQNENE